LGTVAKRGEAGFLRSVERKIGADLGHLQAAQERVRIGASPADILTDSAFLYIHGYVPSTEEEERTAGINTGARS
jgi:hypothetical protein